MSALTQGFDAVLHIADHALADTCRRMHEVESISHHYVGLHGTSQVEISFGVPAFALDTTVHPDRRVRALAKTRAIVYARPLDNPQAAGESAVADITFRARLELPPGHPAPISRNDTIRVEWSETSAGDITVHTQSPGFVPVVEDVLLSLTRGSEAVANIGYLAEVGVSSIDLAVFAPPAGSAALVLGFDFFGSAGTTIGLAPILQRDWAAAFSRDHILRRIYESLQRALGGQLPPPLGPDPVLLEDEIFCVLPTPLGCAAYDRQRIYLDTLTVDLVPGGILVGGDMRQVQDAWSFAPITGAWSLNVTLSLDANGDIVATQGMPTVQISSGFSALVNFLSGGQIQDAIRKGVAEVFRAGLGPVEIPNMVRVLVDHLASVGRDMTTKADSVVAQVEVRPDGVVLHGIINHATAASGPVATLSAIATTTPGEIILHAGSAWAPGDNVVAYAWDYGDGATVSLSGTNASFVSRHTYAQGSYRPRIIVTDGQGRIASHRIFVEPGILALRLVSPNGSRGLRWQLCKPRTPQVELLLEASSCGTRMPGVLITIAGAGWQQTVTTDRAGRARLTLNLGDVEGSPAPGGSPPTFAVGGVDVMGALQGFPLARERLWMIDCDRAWEVIEGAKRHRQQILERLAGYALLSSILKEIGGGGPFTQPFESSGQFPQLSSLSFDPRIMEAAGIGRAINVLTEMIDLLDSEAGVLSVAELLGLDRGGDLGSALDSRLGQLWDHVGDAAARFDAKYSQPY